MGLGVKGECEAHTACDHTHIHIGPWCEKWAYVCFLCRRAELLHKELNWMALNKDTAHDQVGSKVDYWSL